MRTFPLPRTFGIIICAVAAFGLTGSESFGQSGSKPQRGSSVKRQPVRPSTGSSSAQRGSGSSSRNSEARVGLEGYCPVCVIAGKGWVKGNPQFQTTFDGKTYYFPDAEVKGMFDANPVMYTPALGGDCVVCLAKLGKRVPGNVRFATMYADRLFLFPDDSTRQAFKDSPDAYANIDLASRGNCTVCAVEMGQQVAGSPNFATMQNGVRYLFPEAAQLRTFLSNPSKYSVSDATLGN